MNANEAWRFDAPFKNQGHELSSQASENRPRFDYKSLKPWDEFINRGKCLNILWISEWRLQHC
jgi:hypothetical protein